MKFAYRPAALLAALSLALAAGSARGDDIQDINRLLKQGQHTQALDRVNQYLAQKPRDAQGRFLKGLILTEQNKIPEAIEVFSRLSQDYPELPEPYNNLAVLYATQGHYERARQQLEMSIRTHPSYATAYENLGDVYTKLASQAYDKALQLDSSNSTAQNKLSLIRELMSGSNRPPRAPAPGAERPAAVASASKAGAPAPSASATSPAARASTPAAVAAAPAASPPPAKSPAAEPPAGTEPVVKAVLARADAWSRKDVKTYLSFYAKDFRTPNGQPRTEWEKSRSQRVSAPKKIEVKIGSAKVKLANGNTAVVTFRQNYRSDNLQANSQKTLVMVRADGKWMIQPERVGS